VRFQNKPFTETLAAFLPFDQTVSGKSLQINFYEREFTGGLLKSKVKQEKIYEGFTA